MPDVTGSVIAVIHVYSVSTSSYVFICRFMSFMIISQSFTSYVIFYTKNSRNRYSIFFKQSPGPEED